jgi:pyruvate,water dikinase
MAGFTTIYHYDNGDEFPVEWDDAEDAEQSYWWDAQHTPFASTPLAVDYFTLGLSQFKPGATPQRRMPRFKPHPHGFWYTPGTPESLGNMVGQSIRENHGTINPDVAHLRRNWEREHAPEVTSTCHSLQTQRASFSEISTVASQLRDSFALAMKGWNATTAQIRSMVASHMQLLLFCQEEFGDDAEELANVLEHGFATTTTSAHVALWNLAQLAKSSPEVLKVLNADTEADISEALAGTPEGQAFAQGLTAYLARYGFRGDGWYELATPTPNEDPVVLLDRIQQMLSNNEPDPQIAIERSARLRRATTQRLRHKLSGSPQKLTEFNRVLKDASQYIAVKEDRGVWQLTIPGSLRVPCLAAGELLANHDLLESVDDIFYLHLEEIEQLAAASNPGEWKTLVATRRKEYAAHKASNPPANIGGEHEVATNKPKDAPLASGEVLSGIPASAGTVEGRATVVRTLQEAGKLEAGDILVCNSTSPAWSMLFSRISAVVTTGGGPLSHTAIVAREYKIPCVLDVAGVTLKVQDGMRIRVDGTKGTVALVE